jgi:hypothetical protein
LETWLPKPCGESNYANSLTAVAQTVAPAAAPALHIMTPRSGASISNNFVTVQYELTSPASASSTPTFQLRLDTRNPVQTSDTQHTFTGLPAGTHTIAIQVLDANNTPLPGVQNQVQFTAQPAPPPQGAAGLAKSSGTHLKQASMTGQQAPNRPSASGEPANAVQARDEVVGPAPDRLVVFAKLVGSPDVSAGLKTATKKPARTE